MNKRMIVLIALVVAVVAVPASAETLEVRGNVVDLDPGGAQPDLVWNAANFGAFWYDLDDNLMTEELTITAGTLSMWDRTIDEECLIYQTSPVYQQYEVNRNEGLTVDGDTGYYLEGWMAERYVAINGKADTLCKLLVEFEDDDNETLVEYKPWNMTGGFALDAQIGLEGTNVSLVLSKNGSELDSEVVSAGEVYTYTTNIGGESDVPVFSCYVDAIYRVNNTTQVKYVFLIDDDVLEIETGDEFGIMEATASNNYINLSNKEDTVDLGAGNTEHIMGNMYFRTADNDGTGEDYRLRFYPFVEYTEPGTYKIRGNVVNLVGAQPDLVWNAANFGAFWYDLDDDLMTESFRIEANSLNGIIDDRSVDKMNLSYATHPEPQTYQLWENEGLLLARGVDNQTRYFIEGWMGEKYVAINGMADKLTKLLVEFEDDDTETLYLGKKWNLSDGFALELVDIDDTGNKATLQLHKDGVPLTDSLKCINTGPGSTRQDRVYTYLKDVAGEDNIPIFSCYVVAVFKGDISYVQLMYVFLIDDEVLEIETGDEFGVMEATASTNYLILANKKDTVDLSPDNTEHIMGNIYFKTADDDTAIRFYPFVERTIGGEEPTPPPETIPAKDTDHDGVPDVWDADNSTTPGYWVNSDGIGRRWGDMNGDGKLTSVDALMILQAAAEKINLC